MNSCGSAKGSPGAVRRSPVEVLLVELLKKHSIVADWLALTRASNLPTVLSDALVGCAMAFCVSTSLVGYDIEWFTVAATAIGLASFYMAGMVLNGIVDRRIDAQERPYRPIAAGRIRLPVAWSAFVVLMGLGFSLRPSFSPTPTPVVVAALIGIWTLSTANSMRSDMLRRLAKGWCVIAVGAAIWWAIDSVARAPFDLSTLKPEVADSVYAASVALNTVTVLLAASIVLYNFTHARSAWSIGFLALCRFLVPIAMMMAIIVPNGTFAAEYGALQVPSSGGLLRPGATNLLFALALPVGIAIHTVVLSLAARREVSRDASQYRCASCGYPVTTDATRCSECGISFAEKAPLAEGALPPRDRLRATLLASMPLIPVAILVVYAWLFAFRSIGMGGALGGMITGSSILGITTPFWVARWTYAATATLLAIWFAIASTRGLRAALLHTTRKPSGIAAMIAAFALLDAASVAVLGHIAISLACIALWITTRLLQRRILGS